MPGSVKRHGERWRRVKNGGRCGGQGRPEDVVFDRSGSETLPVY